MNGPMPVGAKVTTPYGDGIVKGHHAWYLSGRRYTALLVELEGGRRTYVNPRECAVAEESAA